MAVVEHDAVGEFDIPKDAPPQDDVLVIERHLLVVELGRSIKGVDELVGALVVDGESERFESGIVLVLQLTHIFVEALIFQIGFPVQVFRLDEDVALRVGSLNDEQVCGNGLVLVNSDEVSDEEIGPTYIVGALLNEVSLAVVFFEVGTMALIVFSEVLNHGDADNDGKGPEDNWLSVGDANGMDHLHGAYHEKVDVGELGELFQEIKGNEGEGSILCGADRIIGDLVVRDIGNNHAI